MDMWTRVVLVPENDVGLVAVAQLLHVFPSDGLQLFVGKPVVGMGLSERWITGFSVRRFMAR